MLKLIAIKGFLEFWGNNCHSENLHTVKAILSATGKNFRTTYAIDCLDNKRRRLYADATFCGYVLYVKIKGEKIVLCDPITFAPISFSGIESLIQKDQSNA